MSETNPVNGERRINDKNTSKKGYPIVEKGTRVDCAHCDEIHIADYTDTDIGYDVPGGGKRWCHYVCPEEGKPFAAKKGSRTR